MSPGLDLARVRRGRDAQHQIGVRPHLAGEAVAFGRLLVGQRVLDIVAGVERPGLDEHPAGAACAVTAIERDVDADAIGGVGHRLVRPGLDDAGDPVLEVQGDLACRPRISASDVVHVDDVMDVVVLQHDLLVA